MISTPAGYPQRRHLFARVPAVCIDASHEGLGRQMYVIPIGHILDNPPSGESEKRP